MGVREKWDSKEALSGSLNHSLTTWKVKNIKQRKMGTGFWFFLFLTNFSLGQRSVNVIEREERRERERCWSGFRFMPIITWANLLLLFSCF